MDLKETLEYMIEADNKNQQPKNQKTNNTQSKNAEQYKQLLATLDDRINDLKKLYQTGLNIQKVLLKKKNELNSANNILNNKNTQTQLNNALQGKTTEGMNIDELLKKLDLCQKNFQTVVGSYPNMKKSLEEYINKNNGDNSNQQKDAEKSKALQPVKDNSKTNDKSNQNQTQQPAENNNGDKQKN